MEKLSHMTFTQNMSNDELHFKSKVNQIQLTTECDIFNMYAVMCIGGKKWTSRNSRVKICTILL